MNTLIITAIGGMLLLSLGIIFFVVMYQRRVIRHQHDLKRVNDEKQQELMQASIRGEEEERMRIAAELHDDVGATLSSVRLYLHAAAQKDADESIMREGKELLDDSINKIRSISHRLQPAMLQQLGLQAALESFAMTINRSGQVRMQYVKEADIPRLNDAIELAVYRIVQELTSNMLKHAHATDIDVSQQLKDKILLTRLRHNGDGLTTELYAAHIDKKGALGLKNIVNRLKAIHADISFDQRTDGFYYITIQSPLS